MGSNFATELADNDLFPELDLETAIGFGILLAPFYIAFKIFKG